MPEVNTECYLIECNTREAIIWSRNERNIKYDEYIKPEKKHSNNHKTYFLFYVPDLFQVVNKSYKINFDFFLIKKD